MNNQCFIVTSDQLRELAQMVAEIIISTPSVKPRNEGNGKTEGKTKDLLDRAEVAEMFGISRNCVWRWQHEGKLKPIRVSDHIVRYRREDVESLISGSVEQSNS